MFILWGKSAENSRAEFPTPLSTLSPQRKNTVTEGPIVLSRVLHIPTRATTSSLFKEMNYNSKEPGARVDKPS